MNTAPPIALPESPLLPLVRELRDAIPRDGIHPSGANAVHDYLTGAAYTDFAPSALRLVKMAITKLVEELEWQAVKCDGYNDAEAARLRQEANRFEHWLPLSEGDKSLLNLWREWFASVTP